MTGAFVPGVAGSWIYAPAEMQLHAGTPSRKLSEFPVNVNSPTAMVGSLFGGTSFAAVKVALNGNTS